MSVPDYFEGQPLQLRAGQQLPIDDGLVEDRSELERVLHHPVKYSRNPILERDKPWEGDRAMSPRVIWDPEW